MKRSIAIVFVLVWMSGPAFGQRQEIIQLQADIIRLTLQVGEIQNSLNERNTVVQDLVEQLFDRVVALSETSSRIADALEDVRNSNHQLGGEMRVLMSNLGDDVEIMDRNVEDLRTDVAAMSQQMTAMSTTTSDLESPEGLMRLAVTDFLVGNYQLAIEGFREYLDSFPTSPRAAESQLYLGDAYFSHDAFDRAILEYDLLLQKYPESDKTVSALFKKGLALAEMGHTRDALTYLRQVVSDYPQSTEATSARQKIDDLD
jgi:tol-pal system protein YbgF